MFTTLIPQYLNELVESEVGDFTSPQAFHALKVQCLGKNPIKLFTKFRGKLPMKSLLKDHIGDPADNAARDEADNLAKGFKHSAFAIRAGCVG